jgi:hypothetical protein
MMRCHFTVHPSNLPSDQEQPAHHSGQAPIPQTGTGKYHQLGMLIRGSITLINNPSKTFRLLMNECEPALPGHGWRWG